MTHVSNRSGARLGRALTRLLAAIVELVAAAGSLAILTAWTCGLLLVATITRPPVWAASRLGKVLRSEGLAPRLVSVAIATALVMTPVAILAMGAGWRQTAASCLLVGPMSLMILRGRRGVPARKPPMPKALGDFA